MKLCKNCRFHKNVGKSKEFSASDHKCIYPIVSMFGTKKIDEVTGKQEYSTEICHERRSGKALRGVNCGRHAMLYESKNRFIRLWKWIIT